MSEDTYSPGDQATCSHCKLDIVLMETRHSGLMWVHLGNGEAECLFHAEPTGPRLTKAKNK